MDDEDGKDFEEVISGTGHPRVSPLTMQFIVDCTFSELGQPLKCKVKYVTPNSQEELGVATVDTDEDIDSHEEEKVEKKKHKSKSKSKSPYKDEDVDEKSDNDSDENDEDEETPVLRCVAESFDHD